VVLFIDRSLFNPTLVPTAPLNLSANASSATSIQLAWNQPKLLNGALHDYKIRYKLPSDTNFGTPIIAGTQLTYNVIGLKPFTYYELQVQATTKGGLTVGPWSSSVLSKTLEGAATAPRSVLATAISATSIRLTWIQPYAINGILYDIKSDINWHRMQTIAAHSVQVVACFP